MKIVIFGLTISSAWGNGHATLWRGLCRALAHRGHDIVFFERDVSWYASARDLTEMPGGGKLIIYPDWETVLATARSHIDSADAAIVTSYCADAIAGRTATARSVSVIRDILLSCRTTPTTATLSVDAPLSVNQSSTLVAIRTPARVRRTKSPSRH